MRERPVVWLGSSREDVRGFPPEARSVAGYQLWLVQQGLPPNDWRPMPAVGAGVAEIRVHTRLEHRILYVARFEEAVFVLHAFEKRTRKTTRHDLGMARLRLRALVARRGSEER